MNRTQQFINYFKGLLSSYKWNKLTTWWKDLTWNDLTEYLCHFLFSAFRLVNAKSMFLVDQWKKISHSNLVSLREVFTTKSFGDNCKS